MTTRKVLITIVGHVDHGKTSLLDKIRRSTVAAAEAGAITQAIGVSIIPIEVIKKICGKLLDVFKDKGGLSVPGLLAIDTPGHAAFTSLRKRGGSLADIAILVVDINEGFKPQTIESIEILKANKVPFVIAANKVDLVPGWKNEAGKSLIENINGLGYSVQGEFEKRMYELVAQVQEHGGFEAERFDRLQDYTKQIAIVPISAHTGQGLPELLMVITGLAERFLGAKLQVDVSGNAKGTILEVKEEKGLGKTIDTILYDGKLRVNDMLVIGGPEEALVVKVRALLEPKALSEMRDKKSKFQNIKEVHAATGVKIAAPGLDAAISGMPIRSCENKADAIEQAKEEVQAEVGEVLIGGDEQEGVMIKADTIGGLEALRNLLEEKGVAISSAAIGDLTKRDVSQLESLRDKDEFQGVLLGFNMKVPTELEELLKVKNLKVISHEVIYQTIDEYEAYVETLKQKIEMRQLNTLVRPCKFAVMPGYIFRQNNPAIAGVDIEIGRVKTGDPLLSMKGKRVGVVKSLKEGQESVTVAEQGKQLAMAMDGVTIGRQGSEGDFLYTDVPEEDFVKLKALKKHLSKGEIQVLKEIAELKREQNPVWGVG